ncbi:hypothetical protein RhiXN_07202 [Rhizoctonia solani]|uniref:TM7S3/TM198-like domain-containing protein n=1 Tax=Rhizoctonia solani TaxID=456999 RepID=A0A8H8P7J2_9AGAM|nr:uncharacterized protein RhiXN_07202 [Rhizoctonia solani]QRW25253.1 hypothetical protein RhiXN_07202 [Rhizoctonia solani]
MSGFKVTVLDDTTGAPIPQAQASDGGGLIEGRIFSAPNVIWAIAATIIGLPLGAAGVKLWRVTTALGGGLVLAFAMWTALVNTISESGLASSQSMSDMLILLITGAAFLVGMVGGAFRLLVLPAMAAMCALGGSSIAVRAVILRPGLLVPPGQNQQLAFVNIIIVSVGALFGGLSVIFKQRESMASNIFSTSCIGSFLIALSTDLLLNGQDGMSRGLRFLFDMNVNHIATVLMENPNRYTDSSSTKGDSSSSFQAPAGRPAVAPGPTWRTSVLSLFRVPGRSSSLVSSQRIVSELPRSEKPSNERRGSDAYNYGFGMYALPSELVRQQPQARSQMSSTRTDLQRPSITTAPGRSPQFAGIGLRNYRDQFPATRNQTPTRSARGPPFPSIRYDSSQKISEPQSSRGGYVRPGVARNTPQAASMRPAGATPSPLASNQSNIPRSQYLAPRMAPSSNIAKATLSPPTNTVSTTSPRTGIGMNMLRMSMDSIIDAYGGTSDTGYRYGGSRTGEGVGPELIS